MRNSSLKLQVLHHAGSAAIIFGRAHQHVRFCETHRSAQEHFGALSVESADLFAKKILNQYAEGVINHSVRSTGLLILFRQSGEFELGSEQLIFGVGAPFDFSAFVPMAEKKTTREVFHFTVTKGCPGMLQIEPTGQAESTEAIVLANSKASSSEIVPLGMI